MEDFANLPDDAHIAIYTDGSCRGNPGPGGWGALLIHQGKEVEIFGGVPHTTNNRMELMAVIQALSYFKTRPEIKIYTDSKYVQRGISEWIFNWKANGWKTATKTHVKNDDLWRRLDELQAKHRVKWHWIKAHSDSEENARADILARKGVDMAIEPLLSC